MEVALCRTSYRLLSKAAGGSPVDNPAATYILAYLPLPSFRLIPELEWTRLAGLGSVSV